MRSTTCNSPECSAFRADFCLDDKCWRDEFRDNTPVKVPVKPKPETLRDEISRLIGTRAWRFEGDRIVMLTKVIHHEGSDLEWSEWESDRI